MESRPTQDENWWGRGLVRRGCPRLKRGSPHGVEARFEGRDGEYDDTKPLRAFCRGKRRCYGTSVKHRRPYES